MKTNFQNLPRNFLVKNLELFLTQKNQENHHPAAMQVDKNPVYITSLGTTNYHNQQLSPNDFIGWWHDIVIIGNTQYTVGDQY